MSDDSKFKISFHARGTVQFDARSAPGDLQTGGPYDSIGIGRDLVLFLDRSQTIRLRDTLSALIEAQP